jgi:hypothetical protein
MTGERMRAFDDPVDLVVYMLEKARSIAYAKNKIAPLAKDNFDVPKA